MDDNNPRHSALDAFLAEKLGPKKIPPPPSTDYPGDNPQLAAFIASKLSTAAAPPRELTQAEVDTWGEPERRAWEILTAPGQQQALIDGDPEVTAHFRNLARIYAGEVIDET